MDDDPDHWRAVVESLQTDDAIEGMYHAFKDSLNSDVHKFGYLLTSISTSENTENLLKTLPDAMRETDSPQFLSSEIPAISPWALALMTDLVHRIRQAGNQVELEKIYRNARSPSLEYNMVSLGVKEWTKDDVNNLNWPVVKIHAQKWTNCMRIAVKILFARERQAYDQIFKGFDSCTMRECFVRVTSKRVDELVSFGEAICESKPASMKLISLLDMYKVMTELRSGIKTVFRGAVCKTIRKTIIALEHKFAKGARNAFSEFTLAAEIVRDKGAFVDFMNLFNYISTLEHLCKVFEREEHSNDRVAAFMKRFIQAILRRLDKMSKDSKQAHLLRMKNIYYVVRSVQRSGVEDLLPEKFPEGSRVFVVDPMLATGGTIVAAIQMIKDRGVDNKQIEVIAADAAPPALQQLSENFPGLHVYSV